MLLEGGPDASPRTPTWNPDEATFEIPEDAPLEVKRSSWCLLFTLYERRYAYVKVLQPNIETYIFVRSQCRLIKLNILLSRK